ncbi:MAG: PEGA domain-containing protein, partial [Lentisphaeria bacterium]|nr:PEGA domain-containing protein [Lentisphaeria bacterium]
MNLRVLLPACLALMLLIAGGCGREKEPETGRIEIHSTPAGAAVVFNGKQVGTTPKVFARAKTGHYRFRIEKPGYAPEWREVELTAKQPVVLEVPLTINGAAVLLTSEPAGAAVVIGQDRVGVTPLLLTDQAPGTCQAQLSCPGFADKTIQWTVVDSRPLEVICQLESRVGTMEIITRPEGARVLIAGAEAGVTPFTKNLEAGQYQVKIIKEGWDPVEETLYIQGGQKTGRTIDLKTEPGVISVVSEPAKA